jgi:peptidoglycan L-alanyl-D-glutamate endopeptidase CwlK
MYFFSEKSKNNLHTCHEELQVLFYNVIREKDCSIVSGHRTPEEQFELFKIGREDNKSIVTYKDGYEKLSMHNFDPSNAVDVLPYPFKPGDIDQFYQLAVVVKRTAYRLKIKIKWGGDWNWKDWPHWQRYI